MKTMYCETCNKRTPHSELGETAYFIGDKLTNFQRFKCVFCGTMFDYKEYHFGRKKDSKTPANDVETAKKHHKKHGDMDGKVCLLGECAQHYPRETKQ